MVRRVAVGAVVAAAVVALIIISSGSGTKRELTASFDSATNLVAGARVTAGGVPVGKVGSITLQNGLAAVQLNITDPKVWPLHQGTKAEIRWGGTVSYSNRYVELVPGPTDDPPLRSGARLTTADTVTPVEFDQLFNTFSAPARASLGALVDNTAGTFHGRAHALHAGLVAAPPALTSVSDVLHDLGEDPLTLETLVGTGAQTAQTLAAQQPQLVGLVDNAATTFTTLADHASTMQATLAKLPPALTNAQTMLRDLNPTVTKLNTLVGEIRPGARKLHQLAVPLGRAVTTLDVVAPQLNTTLVDVQRGAPGVSRLLNDARPLLQSTKPALIKLTPMAACLRPYAPELAGFFSTWLSMGSDYDAVGHFARVLGQAFPFPDDDPSSPATVVKTTPNLLYSLVRPPGFGAGQTWSMPGCGAGASGLDPADDPEVDP